MITIYSYGGDIPLETITEVCQQLNIEVECVDDVSLIHGDIALCHSMSEEQWQSIVSTASSGNVRVRMSTVGLAPTPQPILRLSGVIVLHLINIPDDLNESDWKVIFRNLTDASMINLFAEPYTMHEAKRFFFSVYPEFLLSFSILCQGYLATNSDSDYVAVKKALTKMGWDYFKDSDNHAAIIHADILNKKSETKKRSWWLEPFENISVDEISNKVHKEWDALESNIDYAAVGKLLTELEQETIKNPAIVANAYLAITARLEKE
jgi:hypothetical protein